METPLTSAQFDRLRRLRRRRDEYVQCVITGVLMTILIVSGIVTPEVFVGLFGGDPTDMGHVAIAYAGMALVLVLLLIGMLSRYSALRELGEIELRIKYGRPI